MKIGFRLIIALLFVNFLTSCKHNQTDIDTSDVTINNIEFKRLDKDIFCLNPQTISKKTIEFQQKYTTFYNRYIMNILNNGGIQDSLYSQMLLRFVNDSVMSVVYKDVIKTISDKDIELLEEKLMEAVKRFKVFFPKRKTPEQYVTFISGFNYNVVYADSTLGIGLDMYLGSNHSFYTRLQFPKYITRNMNKENILSDVIRGWLISEFDKAEPESKLINHMIFYGKLFYVCKALLPDVEDSVIIGYTKAQHDYCDMYEKSLWGFFVKDNKLFENDLKIIGEYTNDGPFTASISKECPPRIAMWLGWNIVKSYMDHNEKVTLEDLMNETDAQKILSRSKYKP